MLKAGYSWRREPVQFCGCKSPGLARELQAMVWPIQDTGFLDFQAEIFQPQVSYYRQEITAKVNMISYFLKFQHPKIWNHKVFN